MTTVALTASTGMLGSMLYRQLHERFDLVLLYRDERRLDALDAAYGGVAGHRAVYVDYAQLYRDFSTRGSAAMAAMVECVGAVDAVVNSAGVIIPHAQTAPELTLFVNGALPHLLSTHYGTRLIHITTDCVFSGRAGAPYTEDAAPSPHDLYGLSKAMGEPASSLVLRTSIIGPEIGGSRASLLEWLRAHAGGTVDGYVNHLWNGVTTAELANVVTRILECRAAVPAAGTYHVFGQAVSKYELLRAIDERYSLEITVLPRTVEDVDRRLATVHPLNAWLRIPSLAAQLASLP